MKWLYLISFYYVTGKTPHRSIVIKGIANRQINRVNLGLIKLNSLISAMVDERAITLQLHRNWC